MVPLEDTQRRLLEAAGQTFAEKGFQEATVRDILQRADVKNVAAVNYYFGDKEKLYIEAVKQACLYGIREVPMPDWPPGTSPATKLRDFIRVMIDRMIGHAASPWQTQLLLRELGQPTAACSAWVQEAIRPTAHVLTAILQELCPDTPPVRQHLIAFSIVGQCFFHKVARPIVVELVGAEEQAGYDTAVLAEHITRFSLAALGLRPPVQCAEERS